MLVPKEWLSAEFLDRMFDWCKLRRKWAHPYSVYDQIDWEPAVEKPTSVRVAIAMIDTE